MINKTVNLFQLKRGPHDPGWLIHDCQGDNCYKCYMASHGWHRSYMRFWMNHFSKETLDDKQAAGWTP